MTHTVDLAPEGHSPTVWPLRRLTRCDVVSLAHSDDFISAGECELQLDRGNAEFGLIYPLDDATSVMAQCNSDKPVCFKASGALAVCYRSTRQGSAAMKVCVQLLNYQVDIEFEDAVDAQCFVSALKALATNALTVYEAPGINALMKDSFRITQLPDYCVPQDHRWSKAVDPTVEISRLWKLDDISDFVVTTGTSSFNVHKAVMSLRSPFFRNACKPGFMESVTGSIRLEEDAPTVEALLMEIYGVENHVTGSVFVTFALEPAIKKEATMNTLLSLFIAADKYGLDTIKRRAATAFIDRLLFISDPEYIVELAGSVLDTAPDRDFGLRDSIVSHIQVRLPTIMQSPEVREYMMQNELVFTAVLDSFAAMVREGALVIQAKSSSGLLTPPASPAKKRKCN